MWPFSTQQERQAEAMSQILAENAYERRLERMGWWVRSVFAFIGGITVTFFFMLSLDSWAGINPVAVWEWLSGK